MADAAVNPFAQFDLGPVAGATPAPPQKPAMASSFGGGNPFAKFDAANDENGPPVDLRGRFEAGMPEALAKQQYYQSKANSAQGGKQDRLDRGNPIDRAFDQFAPNATVDLSKPQDLGIQSAPQNNDGSSGRIEAYQPSVRESIGAAIAGDSSPQDFRYKAAQSLVGSGGLGHTAASVSDFVPAIAAPLYAEEAVGNVEKGQYGEAALNAVGMIPGTNLERGIISAGRGVAGAGRAVADATGRAVNSLTEAGRAANARAAVGQEVSSVLTRDLPPQEANARVASVAEKLGAPANIEGSQLTSAQKVGDTGLSNWEQAIRTANPEPFAQRAGEQNAARVKAIQEMQPNADIQAIPEGIAANKQAVEKSGEAEKLQLEQQKQVELDAIRSKMESGTATPLDTANAFKIARDAIDRHTEAKVLAASARGEETMGALTPRLGTQEAQGANLREVAHEAAAASKERADALYKTIGNPSIDAAEIGAEARAIKSGMTPEATPLGAEEKRLLDVASKYRGDIALDNLRDLRSAVLGERAVEAVTKGPAYGRLTRLLASIDNALDGKVAELAKTATVEGRKTGTPSVVEQALKEWADGSIAKRDIGGAGTEGAPGIKASRPAGSYGTVRQEGGALGSSPGVARVSQGVGGGTGSRPAVEQLREANAAYRQHMQTYREGLVGKVLAEKGYGRPKLSEAQVPAQVFTKGATGGEAADAFLKATGESGKKALADYAAFSAKEAIDRLGANASATQRETALRKWVSDHKEALSRLPEDVRAKFENARSAQAAIADAAANRMEQIKSFDASEAARVAGLKTGQEVVDHVGSIIGSKDGASRMRDLMEQAKGNPAAEEGIKAAVAEHLFNKFLPEGAEKPGKLASYIEDRRPALEAAMSKGEVDVLARRAEKLQDLGDKAVQAAQKNADELSKYDTGILRRAMGAKSEADVIDTVRSVFAGENKTAKMQALVDEVSKIDGGKDALKTAIRMVVERDFVSAAKEAATEIGSIRPETFKKFVTNNAETLRAAGFTDEQMGLFNRLVKDLNDAARSSAARIKGQSNTAQDVASLLKTGNASLARVLFDKALHASLEVKGGALGWFAGGPLGSLAGILGGHAVETIREAGIRTLNDLRIEAALNPDVMKALLMEAPKKPDTGSAAILSLRLRAASQLQAERLNETGRPSGPKGSM